MGGASEQEQRAKLIITAAVIWIVAMVFGFAAIGQPY
jgi:hypothetical protein